MRPVLTTALAGALGLVVALLVACGGGDGDGGDSAELIPKGDADALVASLDEIRAAVDDQDCDAALSALSSADERAAALPSSVNQELRQEIVDALALLRSQAVDECQGRKTETTETIAPPPPPAPTSPTGPTSTTGPTGPTSPTQPTPPPPPEPPTPQPPPPTPEPPPPTPEPPAPPPPSNGGGGTGGAVGPGGEG